MFTGLFLTSPHPLFKPVLAASLCLLISASPCAFGQRRQFFRQSEAASCELEAGGESTALAIAGPQTLRLADGRVVRLAEILTPPAASVSGFDPSLAAIAYLRAAALGKKVQVEFGGTRRDRYGVYNAHVYVAGESPVWLQEGLISAGLAQAFPQIDNHACTTKLVALEAKARDESRGNWGLALFKVLRAGDSRAILNLVQTYQIVEGEVDHVTQSGGRLTIHFNEENKFGFTAVIEPAAQKRLANNQGSEDWQGKSVRIRGWIERKRGPAISVTQPEQIEFLGEQQNNPSPSQKSE